MIRLLLVEDNPGDIMLFKMAIDELSLEVDILTANNGSEAFEILFNENNELPNIIFLDLKLTKISGLEILEEIRCSHRLKRIPIIILTSSNYEKDIYSSYSLGANSFIYKVSDYHEFKYSLKSAIEYFSLTRN